jgi:hypothetical protein
MVLLPHHLPSGGREAVCGCGAINGQVTVQG